MAELILFNKPFAVLSQFTDSAGRATLTQYIDRKGVYPAGRLDYDSEGLLLLTDDGVLQHRISHPRQKMRKTYWVQVEGEITPDALRQLAQGVILKDGPTLPAIAQAMPTPEVWEREPPVRFRKSVPTSWLSLSITEGRNRQVRRMTAQVGFPTLRLIRYSIGPWTLDGIAPGSYRSEQVHLSQSAPQAKGLGRQRHPRNRIRKP